MTRPWSPAEIAGAKALEARRGGRGTGQDNGEVMEMHCATARIVLDAAGAAQRAELDKRCPHCGALSCDGSPPQSCSAQVRGAGAGERR